METSPPSAVTPSMSSTDGDADGSKQTCSETCDTCDFVAPNHAELLSQQKSHTNHQPSEGGDGASIESKPGRHDDSNNNTKEKSSVVTSVANCSDTSEDDTGMSSSSGDASAKNSYTCRSCELTVDSARTYLHHLVEQHGQVFDIFECDLCEYATRCQQNLPRHRKCHFSSDVSPQTDTEMEEDAKKKIVPALTNDSESCDRQDTESVQQKMETSSSDVGGSKELSAHSPQGSAVNTEDSHRSKDQLTIRADDTELMKLHKIAMNMKSADAKSPVCGMSTEMETSCVTQSPSAEVYFQAAAIVAAVDDKLVDTKSDTQQNMAAKLLSKGTMPGAGSGVKRRTYTPVREAVDPGKYMIIEEIDGTKYACSKCGNIYKWRKSLNKHWKEKHEGQTPDASIAATHFGIPSNKQEKKHISARPMHFASLSASGGNAKKLATSSPNSRALKQMEYQTQHFGTSNYQTSRHTPVLLSSSMSTSHKRPASLVDAYAAGYIKRACYNRKSPAASPARSLAASPADMRAMTSGYNFYSDIHTSSPSVVTPKPMYVNHHDGEAVMKPSPPPLLPTPPTAHARYMTTSTLGLLADIPVDLSSRCSSVYSDNSEDSVLDLSKDSTSSVLKAMSLRVPPPQDEPLDFSAKSDSFVVSVKREVNAAPAPGQCSVCAYVSKSNADYAEHMAIHNTKGNHRCAACQQPFHNVQDLNDHFQQHHRDVLNAHLTACGLECIEGKDDPFAYDDTERTQLFKYLTKKESEPEPSFCVVCGMRFEGQTSLAVHFQQIHPSLSSPYKSYLSPMPHAAVSVKLETGDAKQQQGPLFDIEPPALLQCSQCKFVARTTSELTRHQLKHSLSMTLSCRVCATSCQSKNELFLHYQKHHSDVSIRHPQDLQLDVHCGLEVDHSEGHNPAAAMDSLTQIVDGDTVIDLTADGTMVVIPQAPEETSSPVHTHAKSSFGRLSKKYASLATGTSSASAEMLLPYKCSVCEYRARWPSEITQHMKNHSDEKPYSCPRCTYKSKWKWDVVKHLKRCGGGTVKDVIDNTRRKKLPQMLTMLPEKELPKPSPEVVAPTNREVLSSGPPNVTVQQKDDSTSISTSTPSVLVSECVKEPPVTSKPEDVTMSPSEKTRQIQSQLYCQKCPFIGNSPAELKRHSRVHSEEKPFICKTCGYCSKWKCDLKKHLRAYNHTPAVPLVYGGHGRKPGEWYHNKLSSKTTTPTSSVENSPRTEDSQPMDSHVSSQYPAMYRCALCPYVTSKRHLLESHAKIHTRAAAGGSGKLKCKKCDFEADDLPGFVQHKITHSTQHSDRYDAAWARAEDMQQGKTERSSIQQLDGINYMEQSDASSTSDDHHGYSSDTDCESENTASDYRRVMTPHDDEHSQQKSVNYRCVHCPYETYNRADFEKHIPVHVAGDCYQCEWCDWTTSRLNLLYEHAQRSHSVELEAQDKEPHHTEEEEEEEGEGVADSRVNLQERSDDKQTSDEDKNTDGLPHQSEISGASNQVAKAENGTKRRKMKTCNQCGYITDNLTTLQRHRSKHGCGGKYPCDFCDYSVDRQHVVLYHMRTVHSHIQAVNGGDDTCETGTNDQSRAAPQQAKDEDWEKGLPEGIHAFRQAGKTFYACKKCSYVTGNIGNAQNHTKPHGAQKRYTCEHCDYSLDQLRHIIHHMQMFHPQADDQRQRSKAYHNQARLNASKLHQLAVFRCVPVRVNRKVTYRCLTCAAVSSSRQRILTHITSRHVDVHRHICRHCGYRATTASLQRKHILRQHAKANSHKRTPAPVPPPDLDNQLNQDTMKITSCSVCPFQTTTPAELKNHSDFHGMALPFKCDLCNYSHQKLSTVYEHRKLHKNDPSFKTSVPAKHLINTRLFAAGKSPEHSKQMSTGSDTDDTISVTPRGVKYTCSHCPYKCGSLKSYRLHMELHGANRTFQCDYCSWSCNRFNLLYSHRHRLHSHEPNFDLNKDSSELSNSDHQPATTTCPFCPYVSDSSDTLTRHQLCHQIKGRHSCNACTFSVDELSLLQQHQKLHRPAVGRTVECSKCPYSTHSHTLLEMHMRMHGADNKFTCELCDYSVSRFNLLSQHKRVHGMKPARHNNNHRKTPRGRYNSDNKLSVRDNEAELLTCDRCPYQACSLTSLAQHSLGHSTKAKHSCPYCDFTSMTILQLAAHINLHFPGTSLDLQEIQQLVRNNGHTDDSLMADMTGEPKTKSDCVCHFCDRSFSDVSDLQQHKQMHLIGGGMC